MKNKTPVLLASIIVVPLLLLAWFGVRLHYNQQALLELQLTSLIEAQLEEVDQQLLGHFSRLESALVVQVNQLYRRKDPGYNPKQLRSLIKRSPQLEQIFVLERNGDRLFPPRDALLTQDEKIFVKQTKALLDNRALFGRKPVDQTTPEQDLKSDELAYLRSDKIRQRKAEPVLEITSRAANTSKEKLRPQQQSIATTSADITPDYARQETLSFSSAAPPASPSEQTYAHTDDAAGTAIPIQASGWVAWYADTQLKHIYWRQDSDGQIIGFVINSARLVADLIGILPDSSHAGSGSLQNAEIQLQNSRGDVVYAWGQLDEDTLPQAQRPLKMFPLSHPLGSWRLEYYATAVAVESGSLFSLILLITLTLLGLSTLAWLVYREHNRELELAQKRVNFVNQVSHELKTPLTNIRMYAEMLQPVVEQDDSRAQRYVGVITSESQRLSRLIENVLSFSRLGRGTLKISSKPGAIKHCINNTIEAFLPVLSQRGLDIRYDSKDDSIVSFDEGNLEQILNNLLSNCEKYAPQSGLIIIESWYNEGVCYIRVKDSGPGISSTEHNRIFNPFYRCSNALTDGVTGTGIGLSLARDLARAHGGDLVVEPAATGASFLLSLQCPLEKPL